ncbi:putative head-tail attachment protein [Hafnia phage Pocis76]|uniref:Putative head-tail attachment protein n=1 Tax=Hafnia phage Pocis76 TaxID=2831174 RepID=A0A8E7KYV0_9CAUD|nr:putative head-tail attachment protein [Hafnia phage Pocis76]
MINYDEIANLASAGIEFFSGGDGEFDCITNFSGARMIGGVEMHEPKETCKIRGFIRSPKIREVDGEMIFATDKLGVFNADVEIKNGYQVIVDGETYTVVEARPIRQVNRTVAYRPILRRIAIHG